MPRISVLITCHNRKNSTIECLERIQAQALPSEVRLSVVLVDDGSTDGTSPAVAAGFPDVRIIKGPGNLYWCGGMRVAWQVAAASDPAYYLLLNDDTILDNHALSCLLDLTGPSTSMKIAVAAVCDPITGSISYGGGTPSGKCAPQGTPVECQTFNANCVLIPRAVYQRIGILHHVYTHAMGDTDYGLQASRQGVSILQSGRFLGTCPNNPPSGTWQDRSLNRRQRWRALQSPKGLPIREWLEFNRRNSGWKWPIYTFSPFLRILFGR